MTSKPIKSAEAVAALRAASHKEAHTTLANPDNYAHLFAKGTYKALLALPNICLKTLLNWRAPGSYYFLLVRTRFIDQIMKQALRDKAQQVVILGAGYDSRALRFQTILAQQKCTVFEVDLASTQNAKLARFDESNLHLPNNTQYIAHDFNGDNLLEQLEQYNFDVRKKTLFIWEGVSYYLNKSSVDAMFEFVASHSGQGSSIVFDYALQSFVEGSDKTHGAKHIRKWLIKNNEPFLKGFHAHELSGYLQRFKLSLVADLNDDALMAEYLTTEKGKCIGRPYGHLRLAHAMIA
jgi:methyltransferase (TIGR00027 family)